jgi:hypothetical protein
MRRKLTGSATKLQRNIAGLTWNCIQPLSSPRLLYLRNSSDSAFEATETEIVREPLRSGVEEETITRIRYDEQNVEEYLDPDLLQMLQDLGIDQKRGAT